MKNINVKNSIKRLLDHGFNQEKVNFIIDTLSFGNFSINYLTSSMNLDELYNTCVSIREIQLKAREAK